MSRMIKDYGYVDWFGDTLYMDVSSVKHLDPITIIADLVDKDSDETHLMRIQAKASASENSLGITFEASVYTKSISAREREYLMQLPFIKEKTLYYVNELRLAKALYQTILYNHYDVRCVEPEFKFLSLEIGRAFLNEHVFKHGYKVKMPVGSKIKVCNSFPEIDYEGDRLRGEYQLLLAQQEKLEQKAKNIGVELFHV